jgi:hypothetical protein
MGQSLNQHGPKSPNENDLAIDNAHDNAHDNANVDGNVDGNVNGLGDKASPIFYRDSQRIVKLLITK